MIAMDPTLLKKYLAGNASDEEVQQCERYLSDPANEVLQDEIVSDSLLDTIRNVDRDTASDDIGHLVEKIQKLVPRQSIGEDDLARILSPSQAADELGRIGPYRVLEFIASGGMGVVFKAQDPKLDRLLCIKVLNPAMAIQRDATARFAREAKAAARLRNDRIVTVLDVGEHRDLPYLVMQLLDGQSLRDKLAAEGKLSPTVARKFAYQIAEGLRYAHRLGLLHRDIKPENIWITTEGDVKLLDFGLAVAGDETSNLTATGTILGTPSYMSPEQVQGKPLDQRSDLFSVGTVLFEMLTGQSPFGRANIFSTMMSVANESLVFPSDVNAVAPEMEHVLRSLLAKSPDERIESADELISMLSFDDDQSSLRPSKQLGFSGAGIGRRWVALLSGIAGAAFLAVTLLIFQFNDKGTLVVEADRSVSVSIENEKVQIVDPETGKQFTVTVGDHPLPSGVYQLQMTDASGDYQLSSDVVVIRRGEKQIVKIHLRPPAAPESLTNAGETSGIAKKDSVAAAQSKPTLVGIPTLDGEAMRSKLNDRGEVAIVPNAMVRKPTSKAGVDSWSVESKFESILYGALLYPNANGRWCTSSRDAGKSGFIRIWNQDADLVQMIPVHDTVVQIRWSPEPSILAVIENGEQHKRIAIWKIFDDHVELLDMIPAMADRIAWSWDGLKIVIQTETDLTFYDLAEKKVFTHPNFGIRGTICNHPLSADNRFLATTDEPSQSVRVWDLQEQKLFHIFAGAEESQFLPKGNRIAIRNDDVWEIWGLDKFEREQVIFPDRDWATYHPDPRFEKVAAVDLEGRPVIQDLSSGQRMVREFERDPLLYQIDPKAWPKLASQAEIKWSHDSHSFICNVHGQRFVTELTDGDEGDGFDFRLRRMPSNSHAIATHNSRLDPSISKTGGVIAMFGGSYDTAGPVVCYDLDNAKLLSRTTFRFFDTGAEFKLSPDGKRVAIRAASMELPQQGEWSIEERATKQQAWSEQLRQIRIFSTANGEPLRSISVDGSFVSFDWTPDSSSIVLGVGVKNEPGPIDPEKLAMAKKRYGSNAKQVLEKVDTNQDGVVELAEYVRFNAARSFDGPRSSFPRLSDFDRDGVISEEEVLDSLARLRWHFIQMQPVIIDIASGERKALNFESDRSELNSDDWSFQFERMRIGYSRGVSPLTAASLVGNQIALPVFADEKAGTDDKVGSIGFFNAKSGVIEEIKTLGSSLKKGRQLGISERLFAIGDRTATTLNEFLVFDRQRELATFRSKNDRAMDGGMPVIAPSHPYISIEHQEEIVILELNLKAATKDVIKTIPKSKFANGLGDAKWHPSEPVLAMISSKDVLTAKSQTREFYVTWYNASTDTLVVDESIRNPIAVLPTQRGWVVIGFDELVEFDLDFKRQKTHLQTQRFTNMDVLGFDQCITANGELLHPDQTQNLRWIHRRENRFETLPIE